MLKHSRIIIFIALTLQTWFFIGENTVFAQTYPQYIPSISISESYDSNVFFSNIPGDKSDFVTTITPAIRKEQRGRLIDWGGSLLLNGNIYAKHPSLNYISVTGSVNATLDNWLAQFVKRTSLSVSDFITYTPQPPAFYSPAATGTTAAENFARGIQGVRANSFFNLFTLNGGYTLSTMTSLRANFSHQYMRFGSTFTSPAGGGFFNTQFLTAGVGPQFAVTARDNIILQATYTGAYYSGTSFELLGATLGWQRKLSQKFSLNLNAGVTKFLGGTQDLQYLGSASLAWQERSTTTTISFSRSVFPSFYVAAAPLISNVATLSVNHLFTEKLTGTASANYAQNEAVSGTQLKFISYFGSAYLNYLFTKQLIGTAAYSHFVTDSSFSGQSFNFNRDLFTLTIRYEWR